MNWPTAATTTFRNVATNRVKPQSSEIEDPRATPFPERKASLHDTFKDFAVFFVFF